VLITILFFPAGGGVIIFHDKLVKAHVLLTCTNGVSPSHLPVIVANDRPWTTLSTRARSQNFKVDWIYSTKQMMTQSYGWNLQHSRNKINAVPLHRALGALSIARTAYTAAVVAVAMTLLLLWRRSSNSVCVTHGTDAVLVYFTTLRQLWRRWICWTFTCVAKFRRSLVTSGPISRKIRACLLMTCYRVSHTWLCSLLFIHLKAHVLMLVVSLDLGTPTAL